MLKVENNHSMLEPIPLPSSSTHEPYTTYLQNSAFPTLFGELLLAGPFTKEELLRKLLLASSNPNDLVIDPFWVQAPQRRYQSNSNVAGWAVTFLLNTVNGPHNASNWLETGQLRNGYNTIRIMKSEGNRFGEQYTFT